MNLTRSESFHSVSKDIDSYGRPLADVIQRKPAESYSDSYGDPVGEILTNTIVSVNQAAQPLSTTSLTLNNLNKGDSYGQPLSPVIAGEPGKLPTALVVDSESAVSRTRVPPVTPLVTTETPGVETNENLFTDVLAVFPQIQRDSNTEGIG